jgi:hypothetical protein
VPLSTLKNPNDALQCVTECVFLFGRIDKHVGRNREPRRVEGTASNEKVVVTRVHDDYEIDITPDAPAPIRQRSSVPDAADA